MKKGFLLMMSAVLMAFTFVSCSDDDDGGSASVKARLNVGDVNAGFTHAYWHTWGEGEEIFYEIGLWSFDYLNDVFKPQNANALPNICHTMSFSFKADVNQNELPTGTWTLDSVDGVLGMNPRKNTAKYELESSAHSGNVVISKSGNKYTITINPLNVVLTDWRTEEDTQKNLGKFTFTGTITRAQYGDFW